MSKSVSFNIFPEYLVFSTHPNINGIINIIKQALKKLIKVILQYFKKKENKYKYQADAIYLKILQESKNLMKKNYFNEVNFDSSFELITILLIFYIKTFNLCNQNIKTKINDQLMQNFINDLDTSIREIGIGDMAIRKYVNKYVKKFYYRVKIIDNILENELQAHT